MTKRGPSLLTIALMAPSLLLSAGGCLTPDRWGVFKPDPSLRAPAASDPAFPVPEAYRPRLAEPPVFEPPAPGEIQELSLEQAVMLALRGNKDLGINELSPVIAGTFEQIERGAYDPELFAEVDYRRERASETSRATEERFDAEGTQQTVIAGLRQPLPTGTTLEATAETNRSLSNRAPDQDVSRVGLSVTQSLLRGLGPQVNLARVWQAEAGTLASVYELRGFTEALIADVETAYWKYVLAVKEIEIFERSLAVAKQQTDEIEQRIEVGILPQIEAAAARAEVARREQALIFAQSVREERRLRLLRLLGQDLSAPPAAEIHATSEPAVEPRFVSDLADRLELALRSRPDLEEARLRLEQERLETVVTRNGVLPRLELFMTLGRTGYADTLGESLREMGGSTYDFSAGIRFSHLLGNRSAQARDLGARASRRQAVEAVANLSELVRLDVRLAANDVERTGREIEASAATRRFQEQTLSAEQERFAVGASTSLLVAQAQRDLLVSQIAEVESIVNHRIALTNLYLAEGSLLERRGVTLAGNDSR